NARKRSPGVAQRHRGRWGIRYAAALGPDSTGATSDLRPARWRSWRRCAGARDAAHGHHQWSFLDPCAGHRAAAERHCIREIALVASVALVAPVAAPPLASAAWSTSG